MSIATIIVLSIIAGCCLLALANYKFHHTFPDHESREGEE